MDRRRFLAASASGAILAAMPMTRASAATGSSAPKLVFIGDSIFAACNDGFAMDGRTYLSHNAHGEIVWAWMQDPRFQYDIWVAPDGRPTIPALMTDGANQGISGSNSYRLNQEPEIAHVLSMEPDLVIIGFGANDIPQEIPLEQYQRAISRFCQRMLDAGAQVIVALVRPHVTGGAAQPIYNYPEGSPLWEQHDAFNAWLSTELPAAFNGAVRIWDTFTPLADSAGYRGATLLDGLHRDGTHLNEIGAYSTSVNLLELLRDMLPAGTFFDSDAGRDNLLPNPDYAGSSGVAGPGISGTVPSDLQVLRDIPGSSELALSPSGDGLELVFGPRQDGAGLETLTVTLHAGALLGLTPGASAQLYVPFSTPQSSRVRSVSVMLIDDTRNHRVEGLRAMDREAPNWPLAPIDGWLISPVIALPSGSSGVRVVVTAIVGEGAEPVTLRLKPGAILRTV